MINKKLMHSIVVLTLSAGCAHASTLIVNNYGVSAKPQIDRCYVLGWEGKNAGHEGFKNKLPATKPSSTPQIIPDGLYKYVEINCAMGIRVRCKGEENFTLSHDLHLLVDVMPDKSGEIDFCKVAISK
jgi:hypothetical protein